MYFCVILIKEKERESQRKRERERDGGSRRGSFVIAPPGWC